MKKVIRLNESQLKKMISESVKRVLKEGYNMRYNDDGEPLGYEYDNDPYEQEIADAEEMDRRANDVHYAASMEREEWLRKAYNAFQSQGIRVPDDVVDRLAQEMRRKDKKEKEKQEINEIQPYVNFINNSGLGIKAKGMYEPETPAEHGYAYIQTYPELTKDMREKLISMAKQQGKFKIGRYYIDELI